MRLRTSENTETNQSKCTATLLQPDASEARVGGQSGRAEKLHSLRARTSSQTFLECLQSVVLIIAQTCQHVTMPKHAANMLKVHARFNSRFQGKRKRGHTKGNQISSQSERSLGQSPVRINYMQSLGRPGLWLGSSSFRSGLPYLPYLGTLSYHLAAGSTLALRIP